MSPEIFIEDFERTEYSDYLHGVVGRCLIIATRFDSMCTSLSTAIEVKSGFILCIVSDADFDVFVNEVTSKYRNLNNCINSFRLPHEIATILHKARKARNEVAHSLTKGLEGSIDMVVDESIFIAQVEGLIENITEGDIIISVLMSQFNKDPILNNQLLAVYTQRVVKWVTDD